MASKGFIKEFKDFINRGNVLDMAVGVVVATAFGKITTSLVNEIVMPFIGLLLGGQNLTDRLNWEVKAPVLDAAGEVVTPGVTLAFGNFINTIIDFVIIAFIVFCIVKAFNKARTLAEKKEEEAKAEEPAAEPEPSKEEALLTEIRDILKNK